MSRPAPQLQPLPATVADRLLGLQAERATGLLRIVRDEAERTFGLLDGGLVSVESSLLGERLCTRLAATGLLDEAQTGRIARFATQHGISETSAVLSLRLIEPRQLFEAIRERIRACADACLDLPDTTASLDLASAPSEDTRVFACEIGPLVHRRLAHDLTLDRLAADLAGDLARYPLASEPLEACVRRLVPDRAGATRLLCLIDGRRTLEHVVAGIVHDRPLLAALWIADRTGTLGYADEARAHGGEATDRVIEIIETNTAPPAAGPDRPAIPLAPAEEPDESAGLRKQILALHERLEESNHYELLGVARNAPAAVIRQAYFRAAKTVHPDKLARLGLEDICDETSEVFAAIAHANEVLSDPASRRSYDDALADGGDPVDRTEIARIAQAERAFRKGELLVRMGDFRGAMEWLEQSADLWPEEAAYHATLGWARFRKTPSDCPGALDALHRAVVLAPQDAQAHWWLSRVLQATGQSREADEHANRARQLDPDLA